jgi:hypothetical protein
LINIKIAKAYRTISYDASCVMAGTPPVGLVIEGRMQMYRRKKGQDNNDIVCDMPLPLNEWLHLARIVTITESNELTTYPINIYKYIYIYIYIRTEATTKAW